MIGPWIQLDGRMGFGSIPEVSGYEKDELKQFTLYYYNFLKWGLNIHGGLKLQVDGSIKIYGRGLCGLTEESAKQTMYFYDLQGIAGAKSTGISVDAKFHPVSTTANQLEAQDNKRFFHNQAQYSTMGIHYFGSKIVSLIPFRPGYVLDFLNGPSDTRMSPTEPCALIIKTPLKEYDDRVSFDPDDTKSGGWIGQLGIRSERHVSSWRFGGTMDMAPISESLSGYSPVMGFIYDGQVTIKVLFERAKSLGAPNYNTLVLEFYIGDDLYDRKYNTKDLCHLAENYIFNWAIEKKDDYIYVYVNNQYIERFPYALIKRGKDTEVSQIIDSKSTELAERGFNSSLPYFGFYLTESIPRLVPPNGYPDDWEFDIYQLFAVTHKYIGIPLGLNDIYCSSEEYDVNPRLAANNGNMLVLRTNTSEMKNYTVLIDEENNLVSIQQRETIDSATEDTVELKYSAFPDNPVEFGNVSSGGPYLITGDITGRMDSVMDVGGVAVTYGDCRIRDITALENANVIILKAQLTTDNLDKSPVIESYRVRLGD